MGKLVHLLDIWQTSKQRHFHPSLHINASYPLLLRKSRRMLRGSEARNLRANVSEGVRNLEWKNKSSPSISLSFLTFKLLLERLNRDIAALVRIIVLTLIDLFLFNTELPSPSLRSAMDPLLLLDEVGALRRL